MEFLITFTLFAGKKYQLVPQCLFLQTRAGIFDVSTRAGAWVFTALHV